MLAVHHYRLLQRISALDYEGKTHLNGAIRFCMRQFGAKFFSNTSQNPLFSGYAATLLMAYILLFHKHTRQAKKTKLVRSTGSPLRANPDDLQQPQMIRRMIENESKTGIHLA